jgi:hypothetical protein
MSGGLLPLLGWVYEQGAHLVTVYVCSHSA